MPDSILPELVVENLNAQTFGEAFESSYRIFPITDVKDLSELKVSVYDGPLRSEIADRGSWEHLEIVFVVLQQKLDVHSTDGIARAKELRSLVREIEGYYEQAAREEDLMNGNYSFVDFDESAARLPFSLEEMTAASVYSAVVGLRFQWFTEE